MHNRLKNYALVICLFVFLFVIIGGGLHLAPGGAFLAAVTGTPLVIFAFQSRLGQGSSYDNGRPTTANNEVHYASNTTNKPDQ
jgi:hypothetical protein